MIFFRRVVGDSMLPTLHDGQIVAVRQMRSFKPGQVVVVFVDGLEVIKRIEKIENGLVYLLGDNTKSSTDSRKYGPVSDRHVEGIVFWPSTRKNSR